MELRERWVQPDLKGQIYVKFKKGEVSLNIKLKNSTKNMYIYMPKIANNPNFLELRMRFSRNLKSKFI